MPLEQHFFPSQNSDASSAQQDDTSTPLEQEDKPLTTFEKLLKEFNLLAENPELRFDSLKEACSGPFVLREGSPFAQLIKEYDAQCETSNAPKMPLDALFHKLPNSYVEENTGLLAALKTGAEIIGWFDQMLCTKTFPSPQSLAHQEHFLQFENAFCRKVALSLSFPLDRGTEAFQKREAQYRELKQCLTELVKKKEALFDMIEQHKRSPQTDGSLTPTPMRW